MNAQHGKQLPQDDAEFAEAVGVEALFGETGYTTDERRWARPTFDINGLTPRGIKEKVSRRSSPRPPPPNSAFDWFPIKDPKQVTTALQQHLQQHAPPGVRLSLRADHAAPGMLADTESRFVDAANQAIEAAFGVKPVLIREGGSIPIVTRFQAVLGCDCLLLGWGLSDDNAHSPNEKFRIDDYHRGIRASALLWEAIGSLD